MNKRVEITVRLADPELPDEKLRKFIACYGQENVKIFFIPTAMELDVPMPILRTFDEDEIPRPFLGARALAKMEELENSC